MTVIGIYCGSTPQIGEYSKYQVLPYPSHRARAMSHNERLLPSDSEIYILSEIQKVSLAESMEHETPDVQIENEMRNDTKKKGERDQYKCCAEYGSIFVCVFGKWREHSLHTSCVSYLHRCGYC